MLALIAIGLLTLLPSDGAPGTRVCIVCGPHAATDAGLNAVLFLPIGAALALLGASWRNAVAMGFALTVLIELLQLALPIGRVASLSDIVMNVAGTAAGHALTARRRVILYPRSNAALRYATIGASVWLLVLVISAIGLRPSVPPGPWFGQLSPVLEGFAEHRGAVLSASLWGVPVTEGELRGAEAVRGALRERMRLDAQAQFPTAGPGLAPVVRVVKPGGVEIALIAQQRHDLVFRARVLATNVRLLTPAVIMRDVLTGIDIAGGQAILVDGERVGGRLRLSAHGREAILPLHSGAGWMLFVPTTLVPGAADVASAVWVGVPLLAIGYWTGRRARRRARRSGDAFRLTGTAGQVLHAIPALLGLTVAGLGGVSAALGLALPGPVVWIGAVVGIGFGIALGISSALTHDDRAHGLSRAAPSGGVVPKVVSA